MDVVNHFNEEEKHKIGNFKNAINSFNECIKANEDDHLSKLTLTGVTNF